MKYFVAILFLFGVVNCFTESEYQETFTKWMQERQKTYSSDEFQKRYDIFKANMNFVQSWNSDLSHTHTVGLNDFADISNEEYRAIYLGTHIDGTERLKKAGPLINVSAPLDDVINWANKGAVTPIKNQGQCGSCWSFSTTGSVEALNQIYTGNLIGLSEQNLMDCSSSYGNNGCSGGWMDQAFQYIIANNGIDTESSYPFLLSFMFLYLFNFYLTTCMYPYEAVVGACRFQAQNTGASMQSYSDVQSGNEAALTAAANTQPVSVAIDASHSSFQLYTSGIYYEPACSTSALDHGVLVIGYGSQNGDYYIVKNSWGTTWGMQGYIWMSRNNGNNCGIATSASVPLAQKSVAN